MPASGAPCVRWAALPLGLGGCRSWMLALSVRCQVSGLLSSKPVCHPRKADLGSLAQGTHSHHLPLLLVLESRPTGGTHTKSPGGSAVPLTPLDLQWQHSVSGSNVTATPAWPCLPGGV